MNKTATYFLDRPYWLAFIVVLGLVALPVAVWMDLNALSRENLRRQAATLNSIISDVRGYYAQNVVGRVLNGNGETLPLHNYEDVPGAIPIPATLSIELGAAIGGGEGDVEYRFVSDYPFTNRADHNLSPFEAGALAAFRAGTAMSTGIIEETGSVWDHRITLATPVVMGAACVTCHNSHPESPKTDWRVGDVRGLQTVSVHQPVAVNIWSFKWLLGYLALAGTAGSIFAALQFRLASNFRRINDELAANNGFLAGVSLKISKYLPPQVYRSIFSGEREAIISTERKKLTVFFSDIKDFTSTTESLQPEELTSLLNQYFTEMSRIAEIHGATIDKFIGDAIVAFFGDPETKGTRDDARACVAMAIDMQRRLEELQERWRDMGIESPFQARMGINTGFCNVGNFGSEERMDYTIIGAEANLAARLESIAEPGGIVLSFETYAHVRDMVEASPLDPVVFKGIAREVIPYRVNMKKLSNKALRVVEESEDGAKLTLNLDRLEPDRRRALRDALSDALRSLEADRT